MRSSDFLQALDRFSYDLLVAFPDVLSCFLFDGICIFMRTLFVVYCRCFPQFLVVSSSGHVLVMICSIAVACVLTTLDTLCWIMSVMASLMASMSSSSCSVSNPFFNSCWNAIFFDPIRVASTLGGLLVIIVSFPPLSPV